MEVKILEGKLIKTKDLADFLGVTTQTIYNWRKDGMPHIKLGYHLVYFELDKVMEWLKSRKH